MAPVHLSQLIVKFQKISEVIVPKNYLLHKIELVR
jgi:hypothetical protein